MKKIIRLTESDLARIVKRVIKENKKSYLYEDEDEDEGSYVKPAVVKPAVKTYKQGNYSYKVENNKYYYSTDGGKTWAEQTKPAGIEAIKAVIAKQNTVTTTTTLQPTQTKVDNVRSDGKYYDEEEGEWKSYFGNMPDAD